VPDAEVKVQRTAAKTLTLQCAAPLTWSQTIIREHFSTAGIAIFRTNHYYCSMSVETLIQEYQQLSAADKARFLELIETDVLLWADEATRSILEEEWQAMETELAGVQEGTIATISLQEAIANLHK
jgi:alpha-D-ribose 1-methylphosphonate 5-triphosphate synthase subunit PhnH